MTKVGVDELEKIASVFRGQLSKEELQALIDVVKYASPGLQAGDLIELLRAIISAFLDRLTEQKNQDIQDLKNLVVELAKNDLEFVKRLERLEKRLEEVENAINRLIKILIEKLG